MSAFFKAAAGVFAVLFAGAGHAAAQESAATPPPAAEARDAAEFTPQAPVPNPVRRRAAPRPAAAAQPKAAPAPATLATAPALPATPSGARLATGTALPAAELEAFVDGVIRDAMAQEHIAGVAVSVVQNGQVVLKKGYGFANLETGRRVDADRTLFRIGSISKTFTWIALMKEVEAGRMRLEAPVNLYLPQPLQVRDQGYDTPVRVRNLMDHSAGFEDRALGHLFERRPARERPLAIYLRQERPRRVNPPGQVASYSNYGAGLAGAAVSYVAQRPFERLLEDEIFTPLGMSRTSFREPRPARAGLPGPMPRALAANLSQGYRWTPTGYQLRDFEFIGHIAPAGSASSTAGDMARYMAMLLNGGSLDAATIYGPRTAKAFRTPLRNTPPGINGWAHGFMIYDLPGGRTGYGHAGATLNFMSNMVVVPDLGLGVFVTANTDTGAALVGRLPERIVRQFYAPPPPAPAPGVRALTQARKLYEGHYIASRRAYSGLEAFVGLWRAGVDVDVTGDGRLVTADARGVTTWTPIGDPRGGRFIAADGVGRLAFGPRAGQRANFVTGPNVALFERSGVWKRPTTMLALALATILAACATLGGILFRKRREFRQTSIQRQMSQVQNTQAVLWMTAIVLFAAWASKAGDVARVMYGWPGPLLVLASACALVAAALTAVSLVALPAVWRGGRRVDSWTPLRKAGFSFTVLIYALFSTALFIWGALSPWSG